MAIIRCPYCHAIIDENDKYCNNCGTQLLFPEDDGVEEEIPGEKIVDVEEDAEEKDYALEAPDEEAPSEAAPKQEGEADETAEERTGELVTGPVGPSGTVGLGAIIEEEAGAPGDDEEPEEVIVVDEIAAREAAEAMEAAGASRAKAEAPEKPVPPEEETKAYPVRAPEGPAGAPPAMPPTFDTRELDGIGRTAELGKERVEKMISAMAERQKEEVEARPVAAEPEKRTGSLPPWAARIKGGAVPEETRRPPESGPRFAAETGGGAASGEEPAGTAEAEEEIFPRRKPSDSGIGLPERIAQATLPFGAAAVEEREEEAPEEEEPGEREAVPPAPGPGTGIEPRSTPAEGTAAGVPSEREVDLEEEEPRPPFRFSVFFKAKAFDILFVGVFWLVALWVAARSMDATLFELLSVTSGPVLVLYGVYIGLYFFLFKFFLGETLGDRLFRERD